MAKVTFDIPKVVKAIQDAVGDGTLGAAVALATTMRGMGGSGGTRHKASTPGTPPMNQRKRMYGSMVAARTGPLSSRAGSSIKPPGTGRPYPAVHETGGTIRPTNSKYLAIPINDAARRLNDTRGTRSLRSFPMSFRITKAKKIILEGKDPKGSQSYTTAPGGKRVTVRKSDRPGVGLKKEVKRPARPWAKPALVKGTNRMVRDFMGIARISLKRSGFAFKVTAT